MNSTWIRPWPPERPSAFSSISMRGVARCKGMEVSQPEFQPARISRLTKPSRRMVARGESKQHLPEEAPHFEKRAEETSVRRPAGAASRRPRLTVFRPVPRPRARSSWSHGSRVVCSQIVRSPQKDVGRPLHPSLLSKQLWLKGRQRLHYLSLKLARVLTDQVEKSLVYLKSGADGFPSVAISPDKSTGLTFCEIAMFLVLRGYVSNPKVVRQERAGQGRSRAIQSGDTSLVTPLLR